MSGAIAIRAKGLTKRYTSGNAVLTVLDDAAFWQPAPLLARLVAEGKTFN